MKVEVSYRDIWKISWPIMLSSMANTVINFTDVAFASRLGETALAASALGGVFYFLLLMVGMAIGIGAQIIISRKAGEREESVIGRTFDNSFVVMMAVSALMVFFIYVPAPWLLQWLIRDAAVLAAVKSYLFARGWGLIPMGVLVALRSFYTGIATTRIISYTTITMMASNVVLNYAFVFGHWGAPAWGLAGAGFASALAETLAAAYAIMYALFHHEIRWFRLFRFEEIRLRTMRTLLTISGPIILQNFFSMSAWFLFFVLIEKVGSRELAVSNVVRGIYMVLMTPVWGFAQAANSMVSNLIGQKREDEVGELVRKIAGFSLLVGGISILLSMIFATPMLQLSTADAGIIADSYTSFYMVCIATLFFSVAMILLSAISGTGKTMAAMNIEIVCLAVYIVYAVLFTLVVPASLVVVWGAEVAYWCCIGLISFLYLRSGKWKGAEVA